MVSEPKTRPAGMASCAELTPTPPSSRISAAPTATANRRMAHLAHPTSCREPDAVWRPQPEIHLNCSQEMKQHGRRGARQASACRRLNAEVMRTLKRPVRIEIEAETGLAKHGAGVAAIQQPVV